MKHKTRAQIEQEAREEREAKKREDEERNRAYQKKLKEKLLKIKEELQAICGDEDFIVFLREYFDTTPLGQGTGRDIQIESIRLIYFYNVAYRGHTSYSGLYTNIFENIYLGRPDNQKLPIYTARKIEGRDSTGSPRWEIIGFRDFKRFENLKRWDLGELAEYLANNKETPDFYEARRLLIEHISAFYKRNI